MKESETRLYSIWHNVKLRCYNPNNPKYSAYGGKGIGMCREWREDFQKFKSWALSHGYRDPTNKHDAVHALTIAGGFLLILTDDTKERKSEQNLFER